MRSPSASPVLHADAQAARLARHWRRTRAVTAGVVLLWIAVTFGLGFFARDLERVHLFGWPLAYYWGAQGALLVFLFIIGGYALVMRVLDRAALQAGTDSEGPR